MDVTIRDEHPGDFRAIAALLDAAFGRPDESRLVERLRADRDLVVSLVADENSEIAGQVALSAMAAPFRALGLGPVAVKPERRRRGIGGRLVAAALERARVGGWDAVFVLGEPEFYRRFGFSADSAAGFSSPYAGPHLMALALREPRLPASTGSIGYARAFDALR